MKSKKLVGALVAVVMSASLAAGLSACNGGGHTHSWQWKDVGGGYHRQECTGCDETTAPVPHRNENGDNLCDDCNVDLSTVVEVTSVTLDRQSAEMTVGGATLTLNATVNPEGAATVLWESSDESVATVSASGVVTAVKAGNVIITAKAGSKSAACTIKVNAATTVTPVEMTAEKWEQAFTFGDNVGFVQTYTSGNESGTSAVKFDGDKVYLHYSDSEYEQEAYFEVSGKKNYIYSKAYEYWIKSEAPGGNVGQEQTREVLDTLVEMFPFEKFEKGTANGEYVTKDAYTVTVTAVSGLSQTFNIKEAKINFSADGKVVSMEHVAIDEYAGEEKMESTFTYGETLTLPEVLEGEQVTAEEWAEALAMTDANYRLGLITNGSRLEFEYSQNGTDKKFFLGEHFIDNTEAEEMYYAKDGDKFYRYNGTHGHWSKVELNGMTDEIYASAITGFGFMDVDLSQYPFEAFTYDENSKMYVLSGNGMAVTAMFKDKKLVLANMVEEYSTFTVEIVYGDAQVTLPAIAAGEQVSDKEWADAFAMDFDNFEIYADGSGTNEVQMTYRKVGDTIYQSQSSNTKTEMYVDKQGDKYYLYTVEDGVWKKTETDKSGYDSFSPTTLLGSLDKSDFTYDAASGTYVTNQSTTVIKFVDKKIDTVTMVISLSDGSNAQTVKMYFSYGTAEITLPKEGSSATGGNQGEGPDVKPEYPAEKDITADDWQNIFAAPEKSEILTVSRNTNNGYEQYAINEEEGYIYVSQYDAQSGDSGECVYALDNGVVCKFEINDENGQVVKSPIRYNSLAEVKADILNLCYVNGNVGNVKDLYENFRGSDGNYFYEISNGVYLSVFIKDGVLLSIDYNNEDNFVSYSFEQLIMQEPYWYLEYQARYLSEDDWNKAFEMNYDKVSVNNENVFYEYIKNGNNFYIYSYNDGEKVKDNYYSIEDGKYYRYDGVYQEGTNSFSWVTFTKAELTETEFTEATQIVYFGEFNFSDFTLNEENGYYENADGTCQISFEYKKLSSISDGNNVWHISYDVSDVQMPTEAMTEAEWRAAFEATENSANFYVRKQLGYTMSSDYYDINKGLLYKESDQEGPEAGLIYITEDGTLYEYKYDGNGGYNKTVAGYGSVQQMYSEFMQTLLKPEIFGGETITDNFSKFEYWGFGNYVYEVYEGDNVTRIDVIIKDGKVFTIAISNPSNENEFYTFLEYDKTDVECILPWWYIDNINNAEK